MGISNSYIAVQGLDPARALEALEMEVVEEPGNGRVRVTIRDAATKSPVPKVLVKVIGTDNASFFSGETDLRGVFVAEGVNGQVTAVAKQEGPKEKDAPRYAFHRGTAAVDQQKAAIAALLGAPVREGKGEHHAGREIGRFCF